VPVTLRRTCDRRGRLIAAMESEPAKMREGHQELESIENSLKVYIGRVGALNDPAFTGRLAAAEAQLKAKSTGNPAIGNPGGDSAKAIAAYRSFYVADRYSLPSGELFGYAMTLVRAATERTKANSDRFPGYSASAPPLVE